jgi:transposase InsO family protein
MLSFSSRFPLYTYSDHMPLSWMRKSEKGPSQFIVEQLAELDTIHQYIQGPQNSIADAASRYPCLGPKRLAPRGMANSVSEMLQRLPEELKVAEDVHVYAGIHTADLKQLVQAWISTAKGSVQQVAPTQKEPLPPAELAIMIPRIETAPAALAQYLMRKIPFAILLVPVDLLDQSYAAKIFPGAQPDVLKQRFETAGKLIILSTQLTWVMGNMSESCRIEMFAGTLATRAPITGDDPSKELGDTFDVEVPRTMEEWLEAQIGDEDFESTITAYDSKAIARRDGVWVYAPEGAMPRIIVPKPQQEALIRFTHEKMFHLCSAKVAATLKRSYHWPTLAQDTRRVLDDCPNCEMEKARTNLAHGLFSAKPHQAPRAHFAMDFQGQGLAETGECEALAIIDVNARYVHVLALKNREVETLLPALLDEIVFRYGPPERIHSDSAPEFMSEAMKELADALEIELTTTMGHSAHSNGIVEVFWRFWNRCMRLLPDDHYRKWPAFKSRICFAFNTAAHESLSNVAPHEIYFGAPARNAFTTLLTVEDVEDIDELDLPQKIAEAVAISIHQSVYEVSSQPRPVCACRNCQKTQRQRICTKFRNRR